MLSIFVTILLAMPSYSQPSLGVASDPALWDRQMKELLVALLNQRQGRELLQSELLKTASSAEEQECISSLFQVEYQLTIEQGRIRLGSYELPVNVALSPSAGLQAEISPPLPASADSSCLGLKRQLTPVAAQVAAASSGSSTLGFLNPIRSAHATPFHVVLLGIVAVQFAAFGLNSLLESSYGIGWIEAAVSTYNFGGLPEIPDRLIREIRCDGANRASVVPRQPVPSLREVTQVMFENHCARGRSQDDARAFCAIQMSQLPTQDYQQFAVLNYQAFRVASAQIARRETQTLNLAWFPNGNIAIKTPHDEATLRAFREPTQSGQKPRTVYRLMSTNSFGAHDSPYIAAEYQSNKSYSVTELAFLVRDYCLAKQKGTVTVFLDHFRRASDAGIRPDEVFNFRSEAVDFLGR